jgi:hypothetical protein
MRTMESTCARNSLLVISFSDAAIRPDDKPVRLVFRGDPDPGYEDDEGILQPLIGLDLPAHLHARDVGEQKIGCVQSPGMVLMSLSGNALMRGGTTMAQFVYFFKSFATSLLLAAIWLLACRASRTMRQKSGASYAVAMVLAFVPSVFVASTSNILASLLCACVLFCGYKTSRAKPPSSPDDQEPLAPS